jgi:hypothetical protein
MRKRWLPPTPRACQSCPQVVSEPNAPPHSDLGHFCGPEIRGHPSAYSLGQMRITRQCVSQDARAAADRHPLRKQKAIYSGRPSRQPPSGTRHARAVALAAVASLMAVTGCTQESQNRLGRAVKNWTGTNGVLDIYAGDKLVMRFIGIDKLSTAYGTSDSEPRPYRYGYGHVDRNLNFTVDQGERKVYFEVSDYSTSYVFYENDQH